MRMVCGWDDCLLDEVFVMCGCEVKVRPKTTTIPHPTDMLTVHIFLKLFLIRAFHRTTR